MTPTDELRQAAEYCRDKDGYAYRAGPVADGDFIEQAKLLADAWLAEHPDDDGERVTFDWLESIGFVRPDPSYHRATRDCGDGRSLHLYPWTPGWSAELREKCEGEPKSDRVTLPGVFVTRGRLRRLLALLAPGAAT